MDSIIITSYERQEYFEATGHYGSDDEVALWIMKQVEDNED